MALERVSRLLTQHIGVILLVPTFAQKLKSPEWPLAGSRGPLNAPVARLFAKTSAGVPASRSWITFSRLMSCKGKKRRTMLSVKLSKSQWKRE